MPMSNLTCCEEIAAKSYEELTADFDWSIAERKLGYKPGDPINIGWMCSDRICHLGMADKVALYWEDYQGNRRQFTFDDLDRKSTRLNSSHRCISYAVFCLKKKI